MLALSLITAGLPVHAMISSAVVDHQSFQIEEEPGTALSENASKGNCPHHIAPDAAAEEFAPELTSLELAGECCGPDCRCSCAGLTLIPTPRFDAPPAPAPEPERPGNQQNLPSLTSTPLPRPPQA